MILRRKFSIFVLLAAVNLILIGVAIAAIEFAFGDWHAAYMPPLGAVVDRTYVYHQALYEPAGDIVIAGINTACVACTNLCRKCSSSRLGVRRPISATLATRKLGKRCCARKQELL
jgi:hypothetical protein